MLRTLDDGILMQQTPERLGRSLLQVSGGWFLHEFSLRYRLDFLCAIQFSRIMLGSRDNQLRGKRMHFDAAKLRHQRACPQLPSLGSVVGIGRPLVDLPRVGVSQRHWQHLAGRGNALQEQAILSGLPTVGHWPLIGKSFLSANRAP